MLRQNYCFKRHIFFIFSFAIAFGLVTSVQEKFIPTALAAQIKPTPTPKAEEFYNSISAQKVIAVLTDLGLSTQMIDAGNGTRKAVLSQTSDGGRFYIDFLDCEDEALSNGCSIMVLRTAMNNSGVSYDDLNQFNISAVITKAVNLPDQNLIAFFRFCIVRGGAGKEQLQRQIALFISDMDYYVSSQSSATSVSFPIDSKAAKQTPLKIAPLSARNNLNLSNTRDLLGEISLLNDAAIYNSKNVRFMTEEISALLKN